MIFLRIARELELYQEKNHTLIIILGSESVDVCATNVTFRNVEEFFTESQSWNGFENLGSNSESCCLWGFAACQEGQHFMYLFIALLVD